MKRIGLAVGVVLLVLLTAVAVGNHSVVRADMPARVEWKAVPYGPVMLTGITGINGVELLLVTSLPFTAPTDGFVSVNSTGFCTLVSSTNTISAVLMGWRTGAGLGPQAPGDAFFNNIPTTANVGESLPYGASAVFPVVAGTGTLSLQIERLGLFPSFIAFTIGTCSGVNVVMFTNTQLP